MRILFIALTGVFLAGLVMAQTQNEPDAQMSAEPAMTMQRLADIVYSIDPDAQLNSPTSIELSIEDIPIIVIADPLADRMRAMVPIRSADSMTSDELLRVMQANFDTALDARYAVARGRLWATFIHPLSPLEKDQFLSALVQTVNLARTYGMDYSGGAQHFGGGDSNGIYQKLLEELRKKGEAL